MYQFHASIHALPADAQPGPEVVVDGHRCHALRVSAESMGSTAFDCTFESVLAALEKFERLFIEPDGSLVWVSSQTEPTWQLDGNLYDLNDRLRFVDLKGTCPAAHFDRLLTALGWPRTQVMFQLVQAAVLLGEAEFRRYAERGKEG